eukprot:758966-Hanusia_phi.AAC.1
MRRRGDTGMRRRGGRAEARWMRRRGGRAEARWMTRRGGRAEARWMTRGGGGGARRREGVSQQQGWHVKTSAHRRIGGGRCKSSWLSAPSAAATASHSSPPPSSTSRSPAAAPGAPEEEDKALAPHPLCPAQPQHLPGDPQLVGHGVLLHLPLHLSRARPQLGVSPLPVCPLPWPPASAECRRRS